MKNALMVFAVCILAGCATGRNGLYPSVSSQFPAETQQVSDRTIQLKQGSYELTAFAEIIYDLVAVNLEISNNGADSVRIQPSQLSLADGRGRLLQPVDIDQRIRSMRSHAAKSIDEAEKIDRERANREAASKAGKRDKTVETMDAVSAFLDDNPDSLRNAASAEQSNADYLARHREKSQLFFGSEVAPGQKLGGVLYYEEPKQWPATLAVHLDRSILGVTFNKGGKK